MVWLISLFMLRIKVLDLTETIQISFGIRRVIWNYLSNSWPSSDLVWCIHLLLHIVPRPPYTRLVDVSRARTRLCIRWPGSHEMTTRIRSGKLNSGMIPFSFIDITICGTLRVLDSPQPQAFRAYSPKCSSQADAKGDLVPLSHISRRKQQLYTLLQDSL